MRMDNYSKLLKTFLMADVIKAMERVQDLFVRSQPKQKKQNNRNG